MGWLWTLEGELTHDAFSELVSLREVFSGPHHLHTFYPPFTPAFQQRHRETSRGQGPKVKRSNGPFYCHSLRNESASVCVSACLFVCFLLLCLFLFSRHSWKRIATKNICSLISIKMCENQIPQKYYYSTWVFNYHSCGFSSRYVCTEVFGEEGAWLAVAEKFRRPHTETGAFKRPLEGV